MEKAKESKVIAVATLWNLFIRR